MNKGYKAFCAAVITVGLIMGVIGCGGGGGDDDMVLAKVGGDKILARDLNEIFDYNNNVFASFNEELESRKAILDSLIIQQLFIQEAYEKHIDDHEEVNRIVLAGWDQFLLDVLYQREINDKVDVTEDEIREFYDNMAEKVCVSHILVPNEDTARMILDSLKNGANFEKLAVKYSIDPSAQKRQGSIGCFSWGGMDMAFAENVFKLNPGEISEPFKTKYGWHIARMDDRMPNDERQSYDRMHDDIAKVVMSFKRNELLENYSKSLRDKYPIRIETDVCDYLMHRRETMYPPQLLAQVPKNDFDIAQLDRDEKEMVIASWDGGQMTLGEYLLDSKKININFRPNFDDYDSIGAVVFSLKAPDILSKEARTLGLEDDPLFKRKIKKFRELAMADIMENDSLPFPDPPDEGELRQYYESHLNEFVKPPSIHIFEIMMSDLAAAKQARKRVHSFESFKQVAMELTERPQRRSSGGDLGYIEQRYYPDLYRAADKLAVGDIGGPFPITGKYSLIYVADKMAEEVKDFLVVKEEIRRNLEKERRQNAIADWIEQRKKEVDVEIYQDNLRATIDRNKYAPVDTASNG
ncbi:MAG: peptidylprolyl isomerase [candidate division Zixibacteria bacterium]|nr:peptidylprolyl isomerase [candidate division Zixibacteria bacterium]